MYIILIFLVPFLTVISQLFLKKGLIKTGGIELNDLSRFSESLFKLIHEKYILIGVLFALTAAFLWLVVISKKDLTFVFPIVGGFFYVLLFTFAWIFLGENITLWRIIGMLLIFLGITLLVIKG